MKIPIRGLGADQVFNSDYESWELPPNVCDGLENCMPNGLSVVAGRGWSKLIPGESYAQSMVGFGVMSWVDPANNPMIFVFGKNKIVKQTLTSETDVSRTGTPAYNGLTYPFWSLGLLGNVPVANHDGGDAPQYFDYGTGKWADLPNITGYDEGLGTVTALTAKCMRAVGPYLVMLNVSKTISSVTTTYPNMIKWSNSTDPGTVPSVWNTADTTVDSGEVILGDNNYQLFDILPLKDFYIVYGSEGIWAMSYSPGAYVWNFQKLFSKLGAFAPRCAAVVPMGHVCLLAGDVMLHDGFTFKSIVSNRVKKQLFADINLNAAHCYVAADYINHEVFICIPQDLVVDGVTTFGATKAYVWNWITDEWYTRSIPFVTDLHSGYPSIPINLQIAPVDPLAYSNITLISNATQAINWAPQIAYVKSFMGLVTGPSNLGPCLMNDGYTANGAPIQSVITKKDLAIVGVDQKGNITIDPTMVKLLTEIVPAYNGDPYAIQCKVGARMYLKDPIEWVDAVWDEVQNTFICAISGRYLSIQISILDDVPWTYLGHDLEIDVIGRY